MLSRPTLFTKIFSTLFKKIKICTLSVTAKLEITHKREKDWKKTTKQIYNWLQFFNETKHIQSKTLFFILVNFQLLYLRETGWFLQNLLFQITTNQSLPSQVLLLQLSYSRKHTKCSLHFFIFFNNSSLKRVFTFLSLFGFFIFEKLDGFCVTFFFFGWYQIKNIFINCQLKRYLAINGLSLNVEHFVTSKEKKSCFLFWSFLG